MNIDMTLKEQRVNQGWTQQEIADAADVDLRTVKRWESDIMPPQRIKLLYESLLAGQDAPETVVVDGTMPMSIGDVVHHRPESLLLTGVYADLIGSVPKDRPFSILLGGASGAGKSSSALRICTDLSEHGTILYATSEERIDTGTIGTRAEQVGAEDADIDVVEVSTSEEIRTHLHQGDYSFCAIDSINELEFGPDDALEMMKEHPDVSFIFIAQADATEKSTIGGARWRHLVDIRLWCERDKDGRRIIRNIKNRFAPSIDELVLSNPTKTANASAMRPKTPPITTQNKQEPEVNDYSTWIITRLETDLATAHREIESLRTRLDDKNEQLRTIEMRLMRFEIEAESFANMEQEGGGLSDNLDSAKLIASLDKIAPIAAVVGDLIRVFRPQASSQQVSAPFPQPTPPEFNAASPYGPDNSNFIPGVQQ